MVIGDGGLVIAAPWSRRASDVGSVGFILWECRFVSRKKRIETNILAPDFYPEGEFALGRRGDQISRGEEEIIIDHRWTYCAFIKSWNHEDDW